MASIEKHLEEISMLEYPLWRSREDNIQLYEYSCAGTFPGKEDPSFFDFLKEDDVVEQKPRKLLGDLIVNPDCNYAEDGATRALDIKEYRSQFPGESYRWFRSPVQDGIISEATKSSGHVMMSSSQLVQNLMNTDKWKELFPGIIVNASMVPVRHIEVCAEFQLLSPLAAVREVKFDRTCYPLANGRYLVVDLPTPFKTIGKDSNVTRQLPYIRSCLICPCNSKTALLPTAKGLPCKTFGVARTVGLSLTEDLPRTGALHRLITNDHPRGPSRPITDGLPRFDGLSRTEGISKVTWIEMTQFRLGEVHPMFLDLVEHGGGLGSMRWFWTLSRECRRRASHGEFFSPVVVSMSNGQGETSPKRLVMLAKEMTARFYSGLASATPRSTIEPDADQRVSFAMEGPYWTAAKSTMFDIPACELFDLVCLLDSFVGSKLMQIPSDGNQNCISLHLHTGLKDKRVVRETCFDNTGGIVVTAALDSESLKNEEDVRSVITSAFGLSIHSYHTKCFLTVTYVEPSSSSYTQAFWKKQASDKIYTRIRETNDAVVLRKQANEAVV